MPCDAITSFSYSWNKRAQPFSKCFEFQRAVCELGYENMHSTGDLPGGIIFGVRQIPQDWGKPVLEFVQGYLPFEISSEVVLNLFLGF